MTVAQTELRDMATGVGITSTPDGLAAIHSQNHAATIWRRQLDTGFQNWINALDPAELPSARMILRPDAVPDTVHHLCDIAGMENNTHRTWLENDIVDLSARFADIMRAPFLRLRLDVIDTNACRKFHVDAITARLICTYRGTGTQYGLSANGNEPARIFTVATGAPMIMRGTRWPQNWPAGLLHRSPPIAGTGETRLVLVLDPVFDIEDENH